MRSGTRVPLRNTSDISLLICSYSVRELAAQIGSTQIRTAQVVLFYYFPFFFIGEKPKSDSSQPIIRNKNIDIGISIFYCYICAKLWFVI